MVLQIWFQNKRARWRRRVAASKSNTSLQQSMPHVPIMQPQVNPYGYMAYPSPMLTSQYLPGFYPGSYSLTHNNGVSGMFTAPAKEQAYSAKQWQQYHRQYPFFQTMNTMTAQQPPLTSFSQPVTSSIYRDYAQSNSHINVTN